VNTKNSSTHRLGCKVELRFEIRILKDNRSTQTTRYGYNLCFSIGLHKRDKALVESIQKYFGVGSIREGVPAFANLAASLACRQLSFAAGKNVVRYRITSLKDLAIIIAHFDKYPLISQKLADYILFKQAFDLILRKEHKSYEGLKQKLYL